MEDTPFTPESGLIYLKQHISRPEMKEKEFRDECKIKMCKFYAYNLTCPDTVEFNQCTYQHDEITRIAHDIFKNDTMTDEEQATEIRKLMKKDTLDEDDIMAKRIMLRHWPDYPNKTAIKKAQEQIELFKEKRRYQQEAE